jgi:chromosome segregation ATPase
MIASLKGYGRIARTVLAVIAGLLVVGIVGSLVMGARATADARNQVVEQAQAIANGSLTLAFTPTDVTAPVTPDRAAALTDQLQAIVIDPSDFDTVTLYDPEGTILYSTEQSRIGNKLPGEKDTIAQALKGQPQWQDTDGQFSVMLPLKFRSGVGGPAVVELIRPDSPVASAAGPWRTNAMFLFAMLILLGVAVFGVARVLAVVTDTEQKPVRPQPLTPPVQPAVRPITVPQPGLREESEARRRSEERARAAEDRLDLLQEQYRKTLEELQGFQRIAREPQRTVDPRLEERALRAEGVVSTLQQQLQTLTAEREKLAAELLEATRANLGASDGDAERRVHDAERESLALRHELEDVRARLNDTLTEAAALRHQLDVAAAGAGAPPEVAKELDQAHIELLRSRDSLTATTSQLHAAQRELDDARLELRALRNEEQRATMLEEELRATQAELESIKASHRADLVEREAEFEEKVRATREEFQRQLGDIDASYKGQLDQREAALAGRITLAEQAARDAERELEAARSEAEAARAEAASREQRLLQATDELAQRKQEIQTLQQESKERTIAIAHARKEADDLKRSLVAAQADLVRTDETITTMRLELEASQARASAVEDASATVDRDRATLHERVEKLTRMLEEAAAENADLNRRLQDFEARRQLELADDAGRAEIDELLQVTQERLAGQTDKLIAAEDRVKALESELEATRERTEVVEAELRTHQMAEALREMREAPTEGAEASSEAGEAGVVAAPAPFEDRRASSPFMQELSTDAKKTLSRINGITQLLKHQKGAKEQAQLIKQLTSYARRLDVTVSDIAEADHLARGAVELQVRRTDVEALVLRVIEESEIGVDHEVKALTEPINLRLDPQRTDQILSSLLRNSGDRTAANKTITVRLQARDGGALFSVEDPEPSSDASMSPVVRRFAELQGGWAKVETPEAGGSAFRVFIPDAEAKQRAEQPPTEELAPELRIVVEEPPADEPWEAASAERILSSELRRLAELPADER